MDELWKTETHNGTKEHYETKAKYVFCAGTLFALSYTFSLYCESPTLFSQNIVYIYVTTIILA